MFRPCPMGHTLSPVYIFHDLLYIKASATRVRVAMARLRERERERENHGQLLSLAVQWGVAIEIERAIKKNASF